MIKNLIRGFVEYFRMKISNIKSELCFDDLWLLLLSLMYMIELNEYKW